MAALAARLERLTRSYMILNMFLNSYGPILVPFRPVLVHNKVTYVSTYGLVSGVRRTIRRIYAYQLRTA
jgi:hypothetical protein